jgi:hypothetical protein
LESKKRKGIFESFERERIAASNSTASKVGKSTSSKVNFTKVKSRSSKHFIEFKQCRLFDVVTYDVVHNIKAIVIR